jgi:hypothetical protein
MITRNQNQMTLHTKAAAQCNQPKVGQHKTAKNKRSSKVLSVTLTYFALLFHLLNLAVLGFLVCFTFVPCCVLAFVLEREGSRTDKEQGSRTYKQDKTQDVKTILWPCQSSASSALD